MSSYHHNPYLQSASSDAAPSEAVTAPHVVQPPGAFVAARRAVVPLQPPPSPSGQQPPQADQPCGGQASVWCTAEPPTPEDSSSESPAVTSVPPAPHVVHREAVPHSPAWPLPSLTARAAFVLPPAACEVGGDVPTERDTVGSSLSSSAVFVGHPSVATQRARPASHAQSSSPSRESPPVSLGPPPQPSSRPWEVPLSLTVGSGAVVGRGTEMPSDLHAVASSGGHLSVQQAHPPPPSSLLPLHRGSINSAVTAVGDRPRIWGGGASADTPSTGSRMSGSPSLALHSTPSGIFMVGAGGGGGVAPTAATALSSPLRRTPTAAAATTTLFIDGLPLFLESERQLRPFVPPNGLTAVRVKRSDGRNVGFAEYNTYAAAHDALTWLKHIRFVKEMVETSTYGSALKLETVGRGDLGGARLLIHTATEEPPPIAYEDYKLAESSPEVCAALLRACTALRATWAHGTPNSQPPCVSEMATAAVSSANSSLSSFPSLPRSGTGGASVILLPPSASSSSVAQRLSSHSPQQGGTAPSPWMSLQQSEAHQSCPPGEWIATPCQPGRDPVAVGASPDRLPPSAWVAAGAALPPVPAHAARSVPLPSRDPPVSSVSFTSQTGPSSSSPMRWRPSLENSSDPGAGPNPHGGRVVSCPGGAATAALLLSATHRLPPRSDSEPSLPNHTLFIRLIHNFEVPGAGTCRRRNRGGGHDDGTGFDNATAMGGPSADAPVPNFLMPPTASALSSGANQGYPASSVASHHPQRLWSVSSPMLAYAPASDSATSGPMPAMTGAEDAVHQNMGEPSVGVTWDPHRRGDGASGAVAEEPLALPATTATERELFALAQQVLSPDYFAERFAGFLKYRNFLQPPYFGGCFVRFERSEDMLLCLRWMRQHELLRELFYVSPARSDSY